MSGQIWLVVFCYWKCSMVQLQCACIGGVSTHQTILSYTSWVSYNSSQNWHHICTDSIRVHRLRFSPIRPPSQPPLPTTPLAHMLQSQSQGQVPPVLLTSLLQNEDSNSPRRYDQGKVWEKVCGASRLHLRHHFSQISTFHLPRRGFYRGSSCSHDWSNQQIKSTAIEDWLNLSGGGALTFQEVRG